MGLVLNKRVWVLAERLFIHTHGYDDFLGMLKRCDIDYSGDAYASFKTTKNRYIFMSEENYDFADFMDSVPTYKHLKVLTKIVFDNSVKNTPNDNWNYYGEQVKTWLPDLMELLKLGGLTPNDLTREFQYTETNETHTSDDFIVHSFGDPFLDYIRMEINKAYAAQLYLCVMFLSRKLIETIIIRLFEVVFPKLVNKKYSEKNHELWYEKNKNRYHNFDVLLENLKSKSNMFQEDENLVTETISIIRPFKNETNLCVHADYKIPDSYYLDSWKIPHIVGLSRKLFKKYCNP